MAKELKSIHGVEIFSAGKWNGDEYTEHDLDEMVKAFDATSATCRPALKLGHTGDQKLLQEDGLPAAGWIGRLYRSGGKLLADFIDIPQKIFELIEQRAYRNVSAEIFWNIEIDKKLYRRMLSAVALLGADMPAVANLRDIMALYRLAPEGGAIKNYATGNEGSILKSYTRSAETTEVENAMTKEEFEKLQKQVEGLAGQVKDYSTKLGEKEAEITSLREYKEATEKRLADADKEAAEARLDSAVEKLGAARLCSPAMKPFVRALLGAENKVYSLKVGENEKKFSKAELLTEVLKLHAKAASVNTDEGSEEGKERSSKDEDVLHTEIEEYAAKHKVSYDLAYRQVMKAKSTA